MQLRCDVLSVRRDGLPRDRSGGGWLHCGIGGAKAGGDVQREGVHGGVIEGDGRRQLHAELL